MSYNKETGMYEGYIYAIVNSVNGKKYIGQTNRDTKVRFNEHIRHHKYENSNNEGNKVLFYAMRKYGVDKFSCDILKTLYSKTAESLSKELDKEEIGLIQKYNTLVPFGYNMTKGGNLDGCMGANAKKVAQYTLSGDLVQVYNSETEAKFKTGITAISSAISQKIDMAGNYLWKEVENNTDAPQKIQAYKGGLKKCRIIQIDDDGNIVGDFDSIANANRITGINNVSIGDCINKRNNRLTAGGFRWEKIDFDTDITQLHFEKYNYQKPPSTCIGKRKVNMYELNNTYIRTFNTTIEACTFVGKNSSNISNCCKGKQKTCSGYKWFYANDPNQPDKTKIIA